MPKYEKELETFIQTRRTYSQQIGKEFGTEKCAMPIIKKRKGETTDRIEEPNHERFRTLGETENFKNLGILEANTIKQTDMKGRLRKKYVSNARELLKTKFFN